MVDELKVSGKRARRSRLGLGGMAVVLIAASAFVVGGAARPTRALAVVTPYYLALGDSLAQGVQPLGAHGADIETNQGYVDDVYAEALRTTPGLQLEKLGCPGETTLSMIEGGVCTYSAGNQLLQAVGFLETHFVKFITIDIGANDVDGCVNPTTGAINMTCIEDGFANTGDDLPFILGVLETYAAGAPIYGMDLYDPFLAAWLQGSTGQTLAEESVCLATAFPAPTDCGLPTTGPTSGGFDGLLNTIYSAFGVPVANVAQRFQTNDFTLVPFIDVPVNVLLICERTWMCAPSPQGPNVHANRLGYGIIGAAFEKKIHL